MAINPFKAWLLAARPKTLTGAAAPVVVALAAAYRDFGHIDYAPGALCLTFALLMQIDANFINDYYDFKHGIDDGDRLGPERACAQGWISPKAMRTGITITTILACLAGLPLILWGGWQAVTIGIACVAFAFLYTLLLSRKALGDVLVLMFFGIVPVVYTYCFQMQGAGLFSPIGNALIFDVPTQVWSLAIAQGLITDCLLMVNNFRDRMTDRKHGKTTLVTLIGKGATLWLYAWLGIAAVMLTLIDFEGGELHIEMLPMLTFLPLHFVCWYKMKRTDKGKALNKVLALSALSISLFALIASSCLIFG